MNRVTGHCDPRLGLIEVGTQGNRVDELLALGSTLGLRHRCNLAQAGVGVLTPGALAGCTEALSTVDPAGPAADMIATLWWVMLVGAIAIFLLVAVQLVLAFRRREDVSGPEADARLERVWIHGFGLGFPLTLLAALTGYGLHVGERLLPRPGAEAVTVRVEAAQWEWRFSYEDAPGRMTQGVLHIPARRPVNVEITTADVIHSFWVPRLAGKLDAIPGHVNVLRIEADAPGDYAGVSAEFSGRGYAAHRFIVRAHDEAAWDAFLRGEER